MTTAHEVVTTTHLLGRDDEQLFVQEAAPVGTQTGPAPETVVLCHGAAGSHANWFQQIPHFATRYRVLAWDQRGFGNSTNRTGAAGPETAVADLAHIIDRLDVHEAHLVGQSLGGWAALGTALRHPSRVASVVLSNSIGGLFNPALEAAFDAFLAPRETPVATQLGQHPALAPEFSESDPATAFLYQQLAGLGASPPADAVSLIRKTYVDRAEVARSGVPVLAIVGELDPIFPASAVADVMAGLPAARVEVVPAAGHSVYFERPDVFNAALDRFLGGRR